MKDLLKEREKLFSEISELTDLLHGSWVERYSTCSRKNCECHRGKKHGPRHYLVIRENGAQRQKYISNKLVKEARKGVLQHKILKDLIDRITLINLKIMKETKHES